MTTLAGDGVAGTTGNGGPATSARLSKPTTAALDPWGNVAVTENTGANTIRLINVSSGVISAIVGRGGAGAYSGDGGAATSADVDGPTGMSYAPDGTLYYGEWTSNVVRRVTPGGVISRVAGVPYGVGDAGAGGPATSATFNRVADVEYDRFAGAVLIADRYNCKVKRVDLATGLLTVVAGNAGCGTSPDSTPATSAKLNDVSAIALGALGQLYISDSGNRIVRTVVNGLLVTVAGVLGVSSPPSADGLPGTSTVLSGITGIDVDRFGNVLVGAPGERVVGRVARGRRHGQLVAGVRRGRAGHVGGFLPRQRGGGPRLVGAGGGAV